MFNNLEAEFARIKVKPCVGIMNVLNCSYRTAKNRLDKSGFSVFEAAKIKEKYFPDLSVDYLFATNKTK